MISGYCDHFDYPTDCKFCKDIANKTSDGFSVKKIEISPEQEVHLDSIKKTVCDIIDAKYRKGVAEHGGNLWKHNTEWFMTNIQDEIVDLVVYFLTLKSKND